MAHPSITIVQRFQYRDKDEEFSNRYHFTGTEPATTSDWHDLADALITSLKPLFSSDVKFVRAYGYHQDGDPSVAQIDYEAPGETLSQGTGSFATERVSGDVAMMARWDTGRTNSRGRKIWLRKYYHGCWLNNTDGDKVNPDQFTALSAIATDFLTDLGDGAHGLAGPDGAAPTAGDASQWLTTRTLKRRGKRPPS